MAKLPLIKLARYILLTVVALILQTTITPTTAYTIPSWTVQSSAHLPTPENITLLSSLNLNTSTWHTTTTDPKATLMHTLLQNSIYTPSALFYSTNLQEVDTSQFLVPWFYRSEFQLPNNSNNNNINSTSYFQLHTHGIASRADIWLNGELVVDSNVQAGAYVGLTYDVTRHVAKAQGKGGEDAKTNVLLIKVYPTDYNRDLALGFVDWNPYPPDNGTGIWRAVEVTRTGAVAVSKPRVVTRGLEGDVEVFVDVRNWGDGRESGELSCEVYGPDGEEIRFGREGFDVERRGMQKVALRMRIANPKLWWPRQWGEQPLYSTQCSASTPAGISDTTDKTAFGIRTVSSTISADNDTTFYINNHPFQVLGAGYTSDIFLRFDPEHLRTQFQHTLSMGLNTVRLEGKQEHPYLYALADELGLMLMAGWECCDKWEGWTYNNEGSGVTWTDADYAIANNSMRHEAELMSSHPSMLTFLIGSDFWPDDRATRIYVDALKDKDWNVPIIASASQRGFPELLGNGGMKMEGPYDWVPPNYWSGSQLGAAFGFGSELGAGVGTPEKGSLQKFLSNEDMEDLWKRPEKGLYHMSTNTSSFYTREIYNEALWARYGAPTSLDNYLLKAQMMDYEATRAQFEGFAARWTGAERPATGMIYWMLNNAWPSLHWNLFDYYLKPAGSYFGTKMGARKEHVVYDYESKGVYVVDRGLKNKAKRSVEVELMGLNGTKMGGSTMDVEIEPNESKQLQAKVEGIEQIEDVALLKLVLKDGEEVLSRNVYWVASKLDILDWDDSTWYHTPVTEYADYTALNSMDKATLDVRTGDGVVELENQSGIPAVFVRMNFVDGNANDVVPVMWSENYVTLWPGEKMRIEVEYAGGEYVSGREVLEVDGMNVEAVTVEPWRVHLEGVEVVRESRRRMNR